MPTAIGVHIHAMDDPPLQIKGLVDATQLALQDFIVGEKMTHGERTAVIIHLKDATNASYQVHITADMFEALAATLRGARERFNDVMK